MDLKEIGRVDPHAHWYYQTKEVPLLKYFAATVVRKGLRVDIVDIGAGSGFFSLELQRHYPGNVARLIWVDAHYTKREMEVPTPSVVKQREIPSRISDSFVLLMDVLEHVEKDGEFLGQIRSRMTGGNWFFVTAPAFQSLWSGHDIFLGHYRRYTSKTLSELLASRGFETARVYYLYASIFPIAWLWRKLNANRQGRCDLRPVPKPVNFGLKQIISLEMPFRKWNRLFGLSCVAEGRVSR